MPCDNRVLYVEDDPSLHEILSRALTHEGFVVTTRTAARSALVELAARRHGVLVTDYHLSDESAGWMLRRAAARGLLRGVTTIVVTAARGALDVGGARVLRKPIDFDALFGEIHAALGRPWARLPVPAAAGPCVPR